MFPNLANRNNYVDLDNKCAENASVTFPPTFCNSTRDQILCWPPTPPGVVAEQPCPEIFMAEAGKIVRRKCGIDGQWELKTDWKGFGHSDYTECLQHHKFIQQVFGVPWKKATETPEGTGYVDRDNLVANTALLALSVVFLVCVLIAICHCLPKAISQSQTFKIWKNYMAAVLLESLLRLIRSILGLVVVETEPYCQILIALIENATLMSGTWFLIQTHFQNVSVRSGRFSISGYVSYMFAGWGLPSLPVVIWTVTSIYSHDSSCWHGYEREHFVWIIRVPFIFAFIFSFIFLVRSLFYISQNVELFQSSSCFRRLYLETIGSSFYFGFLVVYVVSWTTYVFLPESQKATFNVVRELVSLLHSVKGVVVCVFMSCFNSDLRAMFDRKRRRLSRSELAVSGSMETRLQTLS